MFQMAGTESPPWTYHCIRHVHDRFATEFISAIHTPLYVGTRFQIAILTSGKPKRESRSLKSIRISGGNFDGISPKAITVAATEVSKISQVLWLTTSKFILFGRRMRSCDGAVLVFNSKQPETPRAQRIYMLALIG